MITDEKQAFDIARPFINKAKHICVLPDGTIHLLNDIESVVTVMDNNEDVFIVKGEIPERKTKNKSKSK